MCKFKSFAAVVVWFLAAQPSFADDREKGEKSTIRFAPVVAVALCLVP
jgi:hypothetical protein